MDICALKSLSEVLVAVAAGWWFAAAWVSRGSMLETPILAFTAPEGDRLNSMALQHHAPGEALYCN
jgi:hypothetical protein